MKTPIYGGVMIDTCLMCAQYSIVKFYTQAEYAGEILNIDLF